MDGSLGEMAAGIVREAGEEGVGSGIPKVARSGRNREKLRNIVKYFATEKKSKETVANKNRAETGIKCYKRQEF